MGGQLLFVSTSTLPEELTLLGEAYTVTEANSGAMAFAELQQDPDVVMIDVNAPILDLSMNDLIRAAKRTIIPTS